jgi:hypothetical protein
MPRQATKPLTAREAIELLGWTIVLEEEAQMRDLGGDGFFQRLPARVAAEKTCSLAGRNISTHRREASSLEALLGQCEDFEAKREALGGQGPQVEKL